MSFGFSVGDIITVISIAKDLRQRFVDAPGEFKAIKDEVNSLWLILEDASVVLPQRQLTPGQQKSLSTILTGAHAVLVDLQSQLHKYIRLDDSPSGAKLADKAKRAWKRLRFEPDDVKDLRARLTSHVVLLNAFNNSLTLNTFDGMENQVKRLNVREDDAERQRILEWISQEDYWTQQRDLIDKRTEGTGTWLLKSSEYKDWSSGAQHKLLCPGIPGAGKTMMAAVVVDDLEHQFGVDDDVAIGFVFCNYNRQLQQDLRGLLSSLSRQLAQSCSRLPESVTDLYMRHHSNNSRASIPEIAHALSAMTSSFEKVYLIIDALDECDDEVSEGLLEEIFQLRTRRQQNVHLLATSRFVRDATSRFDDGISLEVRAIDEDIGRYFDGRISSLPSFVSPGSTLHATVKTAVILATDGMFLLARLHMDSLRTKPSPKTMKIALTNLPNGNKGLDESYKQALARIDAQDEDSAWLAKKILGWLFHAKRQLTTLELQHALAIEPGESELDEENLPEVQKLVSVCAGRVTVDHESDITRLVHYTTQEFLERHQSEYLPQKMADNIAIACSTYLSFDAFDQGPYKHGESEDVFKKLYQRYPFLRYAAQYWPEHVQGTNIKGNEPLLTLLQDEQRVRSCWQMMDHVRGRGRWSSSQIMTSNGLHLTSLLGLSDLSLLLIQKGMSPRAEDGDKGDTPFFPAIRNSKRAVVHVMLDLDASLVHMRDYGRTTLHAAAVSGDVGLTELMLDHGIPIDARIADNEEHHSTVLCLPESEQ